MYGIINKALQEMTINSHGACTWEAVKNKAQIEIDTFFNGEMYDDAITHRLVDALCAIVSIEAAQVYYNIGQWYVVETIGKKYAGMVLAGGKTLKEFFENLPALYASVKRLYFPNTPSSISISDVEENCVLVCYHGPRPNLEEIVRGGLSGFCILFKAQPKVTIIENKSEGNTHIIYKVCW
jgi:Haem-NO-binding